MKFNEYGDCIRELGEMPFDKDGNHATGYEVCFKGNDPEKAENWWNEYEDSEGNLIYGR